MCALPVYGLLTFWGPLTHQPDPNADFGSLRQHHLIGSILGITLGIFGAIVLGAYLAGAILFGVAVWRSGPVPRWAGVLYAPTGLLISIIGLMIGPAQTLGAVLFIAGSGWIAWSVWRRPSAEALGAQPRVQ